jgi:predicted metal-dependent hydrolase
LISSRTLTRFGYPVRSHLFNGFSLIMLYVESDLIHSRLKARKHITDPELLKDIAGFNWQEENHFKYHRKCNELLKANGLTHWLINKRVALFGGADRHVNSFWIMDMIEKSEDKTVAYDPYMACSGQCIARCRGGFHGSCHLMGLGFWGICIALKKDKILYRPN